MGSLAFPRDSSGSEPDPSHSEGMPRDLNQVLGIPMDHTPWHTPLHTLNMDIRVICLLWLRPEALDIVLQNAAEALYIVLQNFSKALYILLQQEGTGRSSIYTASEGRHRPKHYIYCFRKGAPKHFVYCFRSGL